MYSGKRRRIQRQPEAPQEFMDKYINKGAQFKGGNDRAIEKVSKWANQGKPVTVLGISGISSGGEPVYAGGEPVKAGAWGDAPPSGTPEQLQAYSDYLRKTPTHQLAVEDHMNSIIQRVGTKGPDRPEYHSTDPMNSLNARWRIQRQGAFDQTGGMVPATEGALKTVDYIKSTPHGKWLAAQPSPPTDHLGFPIGQGDDRSPTWIRNLDEMQRLQASPQAPTNEDSMIIPSKYANQNTQEPVGMMAPNGEMIALLPQNAQYDPRGFMPQDEQMQAPAAPLPQQPMPPMPPSPSDNALRDLMMNRMTGHEEMANRNLNYWDQDLMRRSRRDQADDFWSNVGAPIAGGLGGMMKQNTAGLNEMAAGWQDQAAARRGERMNLINMLSGRQNRATDYLQSTDPNVIKNQMGLINALAGGKKAEAYAKDIENKNQQGWEKLRQSSYGQTLKENYQNYLMETGREKLAQSGKSIDSQVAYRQGVLESANQKLNLEYQKLDLAVKNGEISKEQAQEQMWFHREQMKNALETLEHKKQEESGRNLRLERELAFKAQQAAEARETANQQLAASLDSKGKPKTSEGFRKLMSIAPAQRPAYQKAMQVWAGLTPQQRKANKAGFIAKFGVDPGE